MKIVKDYMLLAENVIIDDRSRVTIINSYDTIYAPSLPTVQSALYIICALKLQNAKKNTNVKFNFEVFAPDGALMVRESVEQLVDRDGKNAGYNLVVNASMMPLNSYGEYTFKMTYEDKVVATRTLYVIEKDIADAS